jgi:hypothetical protein
LVAMKSFSVFGSVISLRAVWTCNSETGMQGLLGAVMRADWPAR